MKLLVTGASGFVGRFVVAEALRRGHAVKAMVRAGTNFAGLAWRDHPGVSIVRWDLRALPLTPSRSRAVANSAPFFPEYRTSASSVEPGEGETLVDHLRDVDAIIHLAAAKSGDLYAQYAGTVVATENLLTAMRLGKTPRLVHVSSLSVYDFLAIRAGTVLDEDSPLEATALDRDGYARTKLVQERLVRAFAAETGCGLTVLRPGMIYGPGELFNPLCGLAAHQRLWIRPGARAKLPLAYVENVAEAIVLSAEKPVAVGQTLNVIDDALPTRRRYVNLLRQHESPRPWVLPVPWLAMRAAAGIATAVNRLFFKSRAKLPGLLIPCRMHARFKPLRYSNDRIKQVLGWKPRVDLGSAVRNSAHAKPRSGLESPPLRLAYMTGEFPRPTDTFIQREIAALRSLGVHIETFSIRKPSGDARFDTYYILPANLIELFWSHVRLAILSPRHWLGALKLAWDTRPSGVRRLLLQLAYFAEAGLVARRMHLRRLPHLHNHFADSSCTVAMLAAAMGGFTFSFTLHGPAEFVEPRRWRLDAKVKHALFVACISAYCRRQLMALSRPEDWHKLTIVHCGVDPADFEFNPQARNLCAERTAHGLGGRLLFVGRLAAAKGLPILLEALAKVRRRRPSVELCIAGDGPERASLVALANKLGVAPSVRFLGHQSQPEVRELLKQADVFVMASIAEGVPVVLMEAMAVGVPVVTTNVAGIPELVTDGETGLLVPPGDSTALSDRILAILSDPRRGMQLAGAARQKVCHDFNLKSEAALLKNVFVAALKGDPIPQRPEKFFAETDLRVVRCA